MRCGTGCWAEGCFRNHLKRKKEDATGETEENEEKVTHDEAAFAVRTRVLIDRGIPKGTLTESLRISMLGLSR